MKKLLLSAAAILGLLNVSSAQIQKGNLMVGGSLSNIGFDLGSTNRFNIGITPRIGYFIEDNLAIGGLVDASYTTAKGSGNIFGYGVGAFGRYYFEKQQLESFAKHGRFFFEANAGVAGQNGAEVGFNLGFGPGYSYFITPNVGLEGLLKYNGTFGTGVANGLNFNLGFQIYLPSKKVKNMAKNPSSL